MRDSQTLEYGVFSFDFIIPESFRAIYPLRCGYQAAAEKSVLCNAPQALLVYILKGAGQARYDEGGGAYHADCVLFTARAASLTLDPQNPTEYLSLLLENASPLPAPLPLEHPHAVTEENIRRMMTRVCRGGRYDRAGSVFDAAADVFRLLMKLCEHCSKGGGAYSRLVRDAMACVREEFAFLTGMEDLAQRMGVTKSHLIRVFSAETGVTPGKFLQDTRLENAMLLLRSREYTVDMVAGLCGFSGANYFCKVFRRATGESPGAYRAGAQPPDLENSRRLLEIERRQLL